MFKIEYIDVGQDGLVSEKRTMVDTLAEAEVIAAMGASEHLGTYDIELVYDEELTYRVVAGGRSAGVISISVL